MLCFEVYHNGRRIARAGLRKGVLSAMLTWVSRAAKTSPDDLGPTDVVPGLDCRVGGLNTTRPRNEEHVEWATIHKVRLKDEFLFRVTRMARPNKPVRREQSHFKEGQRRGVPVVECSFCEKDRPRLSASGGSGVIAGANAVICLKCIAIAQVLLESRERRALHLRRRHGARCSFCFRPKAKNLAATTEHAICSRCVRTMGNAL